MEINMTLHRTKSILCGLLLLAIAIQPEHHHIQSTFLINLGRVLFVANSYNLLAQWQII